VVDGLRADVAARRERAVRVDATLAGPRATAVILTALPALGALLGSGFGADPLAVLRGGPVGGVLCLVGAGFLCAGLAWTDRIVEGASRCVLPSCCSRPPCGPSRGAAPAPTGSSRSAGRPGRGGTVARRACPVRPGPSRAQLDDSPGSPARSGPRPRRRQARSPWHGCSISSRWR